MQPGIYDPSMDPCFVFKTSLYYPFYAAAHHLQYEAITEFMSKCTLVIGASMSKLIVMLKCCVKY